MRSPSSTLRWFLSVASATLLLSRSLFIGLTEVLAPSAKLDEHHFLASAAMARLGQATTTADENSGPQQRRQPRPPASPGDIAGPGTASCPEGLVHIGNRVVVEDGDGARSSGSQPLSSSPLAIPRIVHQTSKSRCVTTVFADIASRWTFENWSYYFYDDEAVFRLFQSEAKTFPLLEAVASQCMLHGALRSDVFRYLVLYRYGGIYADMDAAPNHFTPGAYLHDDVDGLFVVEAYGLLSQYFMALSPRHPLMWYAVQHSLANLLKVADTGRVGVATITGPHALHAAFTSFRNDAGFPVGQVHQSPVQSGVFVGTHNRSITVVGGAGNRSNEVVFRDVMYQDAKQKSYDQMDMTHFREAQKKATNQSCLSALYELHHASNAEYA